MYQKSKTTTYYQYKPKKWFCKHWSGIFLFFIGLFLLHVFLFADTFRGDIIDSDKAAKYGDLVGGYIGSCFSLISIILLYVTLKDQRDNFLLEKFENKFFQMIAHHEHTVTEIGFSDLHGKRIFVWMIREYRLIYRLLNYIIKKYNATLSDNEKQISQNPKTLMALSYTIFFFGIGRNSSRILKSYLQKDFLLSDNFIDIIFNILENTQLKFKRKLCLPFTPFEGHQSRLGDYYRYLFQIVKFVDLCKLDVDKYDYIKIIRAQLSNHEQALLLINSFSSLGNDWWDKNNYITTYKFVCNIPKDFFNPKKEIDVLTLFPVGYFEFCEKSPISSQIQGTTIL